MLGEYTGTISRLHGFGARLGACPIRRSAHRIIAEPLSVSDAKCFEVMIHARGFGE